MVESRARQISAARAKGNARAAKDVLKLMQEKQKSSPFRISRLVVSDGSWDRMAEVCAAFGAERTFSEVVVI